MSGHIMSRKIPNMPFEQIRSKVDYLEQCKSIISEFFLKRDGSFTKEVQGLEIQNKGKKGQGHNDAFPLFAVQISGFSKYDERLKHALHEIASILNDDVDEILGQILATSKVASDNLLPNHESGSYEDGVRQPCAKKRKTDTFLLSDAHGTEHGHVTSEICEKVNQDIRAMEESGVTHHEAVKKFSAGLLGKLRKMAQGVDDLLNTVASKCRPMTTEEKIELGKRIRKVPEEALNRLVDIVTAWNSASQSSDKITMNLGQLNDATLWRLYFHVEYVLKDSKT